MPAETAAVTAGHGAVSDTWKPALTCGFPVGHAELAASAVAVKPYAPFCGPRVPAWHPAPSTRWQGRRSAPVNAPGRTRIDPTDSPRRMSTDEHRTDTPHPRRGDRPDTDPTHR